MNTSFTPEAKAIRIEARQDAEISSFVASQSVETAATTLDLIAEQARIHLSNTVGGGRSDQLADLVFYDPDTNSFHYYGTVIKFVSTAHWLTFAGLCIHKDLKAKNAQQLQDFKSHIEGGELLTMTHKLAGAVEPDVIAPFKDLFEQLQVSKVERNAKGSKLYKLFIDSPNNSHLQALAEAGFTSITPLLDGLTVVGLKVELPKGE